MFDARQFRQSLEKPTYIDVDAEGNELRFVGEVVSFDTVAEYLPALQDLEKTTIEDLHRIVEEIVERIKMPKEAASYINALPLLGIYEVLTDFFADLRTGRRKTS